jgi:8-amino-7-oxononanoate synthase
LEERFAEFAGTEAALFFTTGYAANLGLLASLVGKDDVIYSDVLNHASLIDGMRLSGARKVIYPHLDLEALEHALRQDSGAPWRRVIVTESIFSMDGDLAPLGQLAELAEKYGAALIVDEAHATGVHGPAGRGLAAAAGIAGQVLASIHTCGKALGSAGGFVCGPEVLKDYLVNHARTFVFSTALPPYFARQIAAALDIALTMDQERQELVQRSARLAEQLKAAGFKTAGSASQIVPVILGNVADTLDAADYLQRDGFAVKAIRPPTVPDGSSRLRLSLTSKIPEAENNTRCSAVCGARCGVLEADPDRDAGRFGPRDRDAPGRHRHRSHAGRSLQICPSGFARSGSSLGRRGNRSGTNQPADDPDQ